jgi:hypothetical protein
MPRASVAGHSNHLENREPDELRRHGKEPGVFHHTPNDNEEAPSPGTSSLTSASRPGWNGTSVPETEQSSQSPAPDAENPFDPDQQRKLTSFSAASMDGSTQGTSSSQASQQGSSEEAAQPEATVDQAEELLEEAEDADDDEEAVAKADQAEMLDPDVAPVAERIRDERAVWSGGPAEEDPSAGGFLTRGV